MNQIATTEITAVAYTDDAGMLASAVLSILDRAVRELDRDLRVAEAHIVHASSLLQIEIDRRVARTGPAPTKGGLAGWQVRRLQTYVDQHFSASVSVKDLSDLVRLSPTYLCRAFKRTFGETVHGYVITRRLDHAGHLMLAGDTPLCEIALACGFSDQAHLSKLFRRHTGRSPARWRRERREAGASARA